MQAAAASYRGAEREGSSSLCLKDHSQNRIKPSAFKLLNGKYFINRYKKSLKLQIRCQQGSTTKHS